MCDAPWRRPSDPAPGEASASSCEVYSLQRGDVILFSKDAAHRTRPWRGGSGLRRALVGRLVPAAAHLHQVRTPNVVIYSNGFQGPYLCDHGLSVGDKLRGSPCFPHIGPAMKDYPSPGLRLLSPALPALTEAVGRAISALAGQRLEQATALALTLMMELAFISLWLRLEGAVAAPRPGRRRLLAACAAGSLLTHPCAWYLAEVLFPSAGLAARFIAVEALVVAAEYALLRRLQPSGSKVELLGFAAGMNAASSFGGCVLGEVLDLTAGSFSPRATAVSWLLGLLLVVRAPRMPD